jgi:photosystem II stability/assembly factor-like uncharacterized protein
MRGLLRPRPIILQRRRFGKRAMRRAQATARRAVWDTSRGNAVRSLALRLEARRMPAPPHRIALILGAAALLALARAEARPPEQGAQVPFPAARSSIPLLKGPMASADYSQLRWRLIGPFRGGWATMAVGVPREPNTFYFGAAGGGLWKTVDAGRTWHSIGASLPPSIGAIAVAPSDPSVIYVGTGQVAPRYDVLSGAGVFKSTDGGRTWESLGLAATRHIGRIWVDPRNSEVVLVAALGRLFGPNSARGIYRSSDGGKTWQHVLAINDDTGVVDLAADPANPDIVYAAAWQMRGRPWLDYFEPHGGPGSGLYRSTDGGASWTRLAGKGWPSGRLGRIGLAVTHTSAGIRLYATVASKTAGGLWRSDDGGNSWQRVNDDGSFFGSWYFSRLTVSPRNPEVVYSVGQSIKRSSDGGRTWHIIKGAPGGDDYHFLWINPLHPNHWITASDQGTVVSLDGGRSWSSWYNQPTGQFYHVAADDRFPYWIYSGQQDSGSVGAATRSDYGALTVRDWHPVGGDERDYMVPDPDDPNLVFGSGLGGRVSRWDAATGQVANVSPWPVASYGARPNTVRYRYGWVTPLVFTPTKPHALLLGAQVLFRSGDLGNTWKVISPDLTGGIPGSRGCNGNVEGERARACGFGVISAISPSPHSAGIIWVGSDSGLVELTRDDGAHWRNVTPPALGPWEKVTSVDASALDPASAYVSVDNQRQDDYAPHIFRTHDYGSTWTEIDRGLPPEHQVLVVRADPVRRGLLYAGTTRGVYVSLDDGNHWSSLKLDLPNAQVNDLLVHGDDLIAATQGRALWVLDDVTPLRQLSSAILASPAHLFAPEVAWRVHPDNNRDTPLPPGTPEGQNPPAGAVIDYWLGPGIHGPVTLAIVSFAGQLVRRFSSAEAPRPLNAARYFDKLWVRPPRRLSGAPGMHRFVWNLRYARPQAISNGYSMAAVPGRNTPPAIDGPFVLPGIYSIVLTADGVTYRAPLVVQLDPRVHTSSADLASLLEFSQSLCAGLERAKALYDGEHPAHAALVALVRRLASGRVPGALKGEVRRLAAASSVEGPGSVDAISRVIGALEADEESADVAPTAAQREVFERSSRKLDRAIERWQRTRREILSLDVRLRRAGLQAVPVTE